MKKALLTVHPVIPVLNIDCGIPSMLSIMFILPLNEKD